MTDFKIEVIVQDVTRGDVAIITDFLADVADDFDAARGDFTVQVWERENDSRPWFYEQDAAEA